MSLTDSYKSRDLESGVILTKFLIFGRFQPRDSYKKNSYKKETVCLLRELFLSFFIKLYFFFHFLMYVDFSHMANATCRK